MKAGSEERREYDRLRALQYYYAHREHCIKHNQLWKRDHPDAVAKVKREWDINNAQHIKQWGVDYRKKHNAELNLKHAQWRKEHQELNRRIKQESRLKHIEKRRVECSNRKARKRSAIGTYAVMDVQRLYERQGGCCAACAISFDQNKQARFHVDHIMPLILGGSNWPGNLQLLCPSCNMRKGKMHPDTWAKIVATMP